ncbi:MAG: hypothetical protein JXB49_11800 [Bacteroidales bacterium]|nr:hypothetical protein [Bacteroidales bacterium]
MKKVMILSGILVGLMFVFQQCNVSTANIADVKMCESPNGYLCSEDNTVFSTSSPEIHVSCVLKNATEGSKITFTWYYQGEEKILIDEASFVAKDVTSDVHSSLSIPDAGWPTGNYEVVISLDTDNSKPITKSFSVQ